VAGRSASYRSPLAQHWYVPAAVRAPRASHLLEQPPGGRRSTKAACGESRRPGRGPARSGERTWPTARHAKRFLSKPAAHPRVPCRRHPGPLQQPVFRLGRRARGVRPGGEHPPKLPVEGRSGTAVGCSCRAWPRALDRTSVRRPLPQPPARAGQNGRHDQRSPLTAIDAHLSPRSTTSSAAPGSPGTGRRTSRTRTLATVSCVPAGKRP
jgi:hypothetical protein